MVSTTAEQSGILEAVFAAVRSNDIATARKLARGALAGGVEHPVLLNLRAMEFENAGRLADALTDLRRAHFLSPKDFAILNATGLCLARMERPEEALRCYDQALTLNPDFGPAWFNRGWALERLGRMVEAAAAYTRSVEIHPQNSQGWASLAALAARRGDAAAVHNFAERALALQPGHATAVLALAAVELSEPRAAERRLRDLLAGTLAPFDRALALGQLGDALDAMDKPAQAFAAYARSNTLFRNEVKERFEGPGQTTVAQSLTWLNDWADALDPAVWPSTDDADHLTGERGHVFLTGFPRSGTTLLESVLAAHPDVVTLEEKNALTTSVLAFLDLPEDMARLTEASAEHLRSLREDYWTQVRRHGVEPSGKIFIDKNPFNTLKLGVIRRLFPHAKILFAVRDPRDVVLSCFRRRFNLNASTYELLDLDRAGANYAQSMRFAQTLRDKLGFDEHQLVYERLVEDFEGQTRAVCQFIGADWRDDLSDFAARAERGGIGSASSAQIARGLYSEGATHWRRYRAQLAPVLPVLAPWVELFGYPPG